VLCYMSNLWAFESSQGSTSIFTCGTLRRSTSTTPVPVQMEGVSEMMIRICATWCSVVMLFVDPVSFANSDLVFSLMTRNIWSWADLWGDF
jgi:hypothetical protein